MKRTLALIVAAMTFLAAGALYGQFRERSRSSGRDRSSERSSGNFGGSFGPSSRESATSAGAGSSRPAAEGPSSGRYLPGEYVLLARKSIFARDRHAYVERPRETRETTRIAETHPAPPPAIPVLVGVLIGDNDLIAYIEDPDTGKLWPLAAGDPLPGSYGSVVRVTLDDMTIAADGGPEHRILIGQNLAGENASSRSLSSPSASDATTAASTASSATTGPATTGPAGDPNEPGISIEEKMRRRRLQQLGK